MVLFFHNIIGFGIFDVKAAAAGIEWPKMPSRSWWEIVTIVGGTLIVVQGFETSRYLGAEYDEATRIKSCRLSQIVSTIVYLVFIVLATRRNSPAREGDSPAAAALIVVIRSSRFEPFST